MHSTLSKNVLRLNYLLTAALSLALPLAAGTRGGRDLPYEDLARGWLAKNGVVAAGPESLDLDALFEQHLTHVRLGAFEVLVPAAALIDPAWQDELGATFSALFHVQEQWFAWTAGGAPLPSQIQGDLKTIRPWLQSWKSELPADARSLEGAELFSALAPEENVRAALARLTDAFSRGGALALSEPRTVRLILMPSRRDFIGFTCALGWKPGPARAAFWADGLRIWCHLDYAGTRALALEFGAGGDDPFRGLSMTEKNPRGLEQHVAQLATRSLLETFSGAELPLGLAGALANSLVIDGWGQVDTRVDGDLRGRALADQSGFIAGGSSSGGSFAPQQAISRWRKGMGADHFVEVLRRAAEACDAKAKPKKRASGRKPSASKTSSGESPAFMLLSDDESERLVVCAPFLASEADDVAAPAVFAGDRAEFLRAYRAAFLYWLREHAEGTPKDSRARFASFLNALANAPATSEFSAVVASIYGAPLSAATMDESSLEGRFLAWVR